MIQNISYWEAVRLIECMDDLAYIPKDRDYAWFAFYAGKQKPSNTVFGLYSRNEDGILGIIAREKVQQVMSEMELVRELVR